MFEISILVRNAQGDVIIDKNGNPKRRFFRDDSPYKLWEWWNRNTFHRPKKKTSRAANPNEVKQAMVNIEEFAKKKNVNDNVDDNVE